MYSIYVYYERYNCPHCLVDDDAHGLQMRKAHFHSPFKGLTLFSAESAMHVTAKTVCYQ